MLSKIGSLLSKASTITLFMGVIFSIIFWQVSYKEQQNREKIRFDALAQEIKSTIISRMQAYQQILQDGEGMFYASDSVERKEWEEYVKQIKLGSVFKGIHGLSYVKVVRKNEKDSFVGHIRKEIKNFQIKPDGDRDVYAVVTYIAPSNEKNLKVLGLDNYAESIRREGIDRAIKSGEVALSGKVQIIQNETEKSENGFLMIAPIYKKGYELKSESDRYSAIDGFVTSAFRTKELLEDVLGSRYDGMLSFELYDTVSTGRANLLYGDDYDTSYLPSFFVEEQIEIGGRLWTLRFKPLPSFFVELDHNSPNYIFAGCLLLSLLIFTLVLQMEHTRQKASNIAAEMSNELLLEEQALKKALEFQKVLFENNAVAFILMSPQRIIEKVNNEFCNLLGYEQEELVGQSPKMIHISDSSFLGWAPVFEEVKADKEVANIEYPLKRKNGEIIWCDFYGTTITFDNDTKGVLWSILNITKQKQLQKELEESNKEIKHMNEHLLDLVSKETARRAEKEQMLVQQSKMAMMGEMIGAIAHQWRQPLNSLAINIQDVVMAKQFEELTKEYLNAFKNDSMKIIQTMSKTIDDFRNFFSPDKQKESFSVEGAVKETLRILKAQLDSYEITAKFEYTDENYFVGYKNELKQVLLNLIANAKDAILFSGSEHKLISISVIANTKEIIIMIEDTGGGIDENIINRIFEPYFTTKEQGLGTGIGLYMSREIIQRHMHGKLEASNVEFGALFVITLPIIDSEDRSKES